MTVAAPLNSWRDHTGRAFLRFMGTGVQQFPTAVISAEGASREGFCHAPHFAQRMERVR